MTDMPEHCLVVLGSINTDLVIRGHTLPRPGETVLGGAFLQAAGGKGANQAVAAVRAGGNRETQAVRLIAAVGGDTFGQAALQVLRSEQIDLRMVKTVADQPSGVALILVDQGGENLISVASGANACLAPEDIDRLDEDVFRAAGVFLAGLEIPLETMHRGLRAPNDAAP